MEFFQKIYQLFSYSVVESTNCAVRQLYQPGQTLPIVIAEKQTAGRGTQGKIWHSPEGNLYVSFIIEQDFTPLQAGQLSLLTGLSIYNVLKGLFPEENFLCKWPNDILLNNKKMGGILIEKDFKKDHPYFIIGIGLNLLQSDSSSHFASTSLKEENILTANESMTDSMTPQWWAEQIISQLSTIYAQWITQGFDFWQQLWNKCCYGWGKEVKLSQENFSITGMFKGIDAQGILLIQNPGGLHRLASGSLKYDDKKV